ncbi:MAG: hypothetical protein HRT88_23440, partial [Lentisphaeraceae bacterium]|nr:hypothetical protein [Lentisphaeraceae bacterium]
MSSSSKSFTAKYSFPIGIIVTCLFLVAAGFLESTIEALFSFHSSNPKLSFFIWTDLFLTALVIVFYGDLKKFVKKDRVIFRSLRSLASLRFTVFLFSFSLFLVFVGTIGQTEKGIWEAVNDYFRCFVGRVPLSIFFKGDSSEALRNLHFFFPGGYLIGIFLLVNLLTAHTLKFKLNATKKNIIWGSAVTLVGLGLLGMVIYNGIVREDIPSAYIDSYTRVLYRLLNGLGVSLVILTGCWGLFKKRAGIVLLHFGVILLLFSELVTGIFATEGNMRIAEGASSSFVSLSRRYELAISLADENSAGEKSVVVPWNLLKDNNEWQSHKSLPFSFRVNKWLINSSVEERKVAANEKFKGLASRYRLEANKEVSGVDGADINIPAMEIEIRDNAGESLGQYIF